MLPQLRGLGHSPTAQRYGIVSLEEARAYLRDPVLEPRLRACCAALLALAPERSADAVLGTLDARKLRSSMTLFLRADPGDPIFSAVLERFFAGTPDERTDGLLRTQIG